MEAGPARERVGSLYTKQLGFLGCKLLFGKEAMVFEGGQVLELRDHIILRWRWSCRWRRRLRSIILESEKGFTVRITLTNGLVFILPPSHR